MYKKYEKKPMINLTGLWKTESKNGNVYLRGTIKPGILPGVNHNIKIMAFQNNKRNDKDPDFNLVYVEDKEEVGVSF